MPHEGYADPITNDGPAFYSNMPISELTEHVQAVEASDISSTPLVAETVDGATITKMSRPSTGTLLHRGLEESWTHNDTERAVIERWLRSKGRGMHENKRRFLLLVSLPSPQSLVTPNPSNGKGLGLT